MYIIFSKFNVKYKIPFLCSSTSQWRFFWNVRGIEIKNPELHFMFAFGIIDQRFCLLLNLFMGMFMIFLETGLGSICLRFVSVFLFYCGFWFGWSASTFFSFNKIFRAWWEKMEAVLEWKLSWDVLTSPDVFYCFWLSKNKITFLLK